MTEKNKNDRPVLVRYNNKLKQGLNNGIKFTKLIDRLVKTQDPLRLLKAAKQLVSYQLDTKYVQFPQQFGSTDYYLAFMNRLLTIHDLNDRLSIKSDHGTFYQVASVLGDRDHFNFKLDLQAKSEGDAYYRDTHFHENLFYINLEHKILRFNSHALTELFVVDFYNKIDLHKIKQLANTLFNFAKFLQKDYNFNVNFSILNADNNRFYQFNEPKLSTDVMDKLFITSAQHHFMLKSYYHNGAQLRLSDDILINIYPNSAKQWGLEIKDSNQDYSWFDILLKYDFLRKWYLDDIDQLLLN